MEFKEKLSFLRKQHGMTQMELAGKLDISRQAVSRWEQGTSEPSTENLVSIGKLFGVPVDALVNENVQLQAESAVKIVVKAQEPNESTNFFRGSSHVKLKKQVIICFVAIILVLIASLFCFGMRGSGQEPKKPVSVDELERGKLGEDGAGELYLEDMECELIDMSALDSLGENTITRGTKSISGTVAAYSHSISTEKIFLVERGIVTINCSYSPSSASVDFGIIAPDGYFYFLNVEGGSINRSIRVNQSGNYAVAIRNNSSNTIYVTGFVEY